MRLRHAPIGLRDASVISDEFTVHERPDPPCVRPVVAGGVLIVDQLTPERANRVALTMAQRAPMEYYETIVDQMFADTAHFVDRLEKSGHISAFTARLAQ